MKLTVPKLCSYLGGIFLIAVGVNLSKMAGLGISPVASLPYAVELSWGIELGIATAIVYVFLILLQLVLLRKLSVLPFLQLLTTVVMSVFTTLTSPDYLLRWLPRPDAYLQSLLFLAISIILIGIGVYFYINPNYVPLPSEGIAKTITEISNGKIQFHNSKIIVDCSLVVSAIIVTLLMMGKVAGVREGTVITALLVGKMVGLCKMIDQKITPKTMDGERKSDEPLCIPEDSD